MSEMKTVSLKEMFEMMKNLPDGTLLTVSVEDGAVEAEVESGPGLDSAASSNLAAGDRFDSGHIDATGVRLNTDPADARRGEDADGTSSGV